MSQFFREADVRPFKFHKTQKDEVAGVRLFCTQAFDDPRYALQLRGRIRLGNSAGLGREGKDFIIAHAVLSLDDLRAIRDAIDEVLVSHEAEQDDDAARVRIMKRLEQASTLLAMEHEAWAPLRQAHHAIGQIADILKSIDKDIVGAIVGTGGRLESD